MPDKSKPTKKPKKKAAGKSTRKSTGKATIKAAAEPQSPTAEAIGNIPINSFPINDSPINVAPINNNPISDIPITNPILNPILNPIRPFPIFINTNPAISSLSPAGAVVGGSSFTLTVLGSNFGSGSTVQWNQSPRATTVVSATQLTIPVDASDLAAVEAAAVVVSNQGAAGTAPVMSNVVQFNIIPDISAIISQLQAITAIPANLLSELQTYITIEQSQVDTLSSQVSADQTNAATLNSQIANLQTQVTQQQTEINTLTSQLQSSKSQSASPLDVAQSFKSVVDQIQQAAQAAGGIQSTVNNMSVQLKSLVSVQAATATTPALASLIFPDPTALPDPQHLSTLSFSFGAIPSLATQASAAPTPAPPAPSAPSVVVSQPTTTPVGAPIGADATHDSGGAVSQDVVAAFEAPPVMAPSVKAGTKSKAAGGPRGNAKKSKTDAGK